MTWALERTKSQNKREKGKTVERKVISATGDNGIDKSVPGKAKFLGRTVGKKPESKK